MTPDARTQDTRDLTRWERYYLKRARRGQYVSLPRNNRVEDSLIDKGYIRGFGFVMGNRCEHRLTQKGVDVWEALNTSHATATDDAGDRSE